LTHWVERDRSFSAQPYLPAAGESPLDWSARVAALVGGRDSSLLVHAAQAADWDFFFAAREFLRGFVERVGLSDYVDSTIYLSRARRTVFGVHADAAHNFLFVTHGVKRFRLWPHEVVATHPRCHESTEWDEIAAQAQSIELRRGDFLFLPAGYYHAAEAASEMAIHLSLLVDVAPDMSKRFVCSHVEQLLARRLRCEPSAPFFAAALSGDPGGGLALPAPLDRYVAALGRPLDHELGRTLVEAWARLRSADGFVDVPPPVPTTALDDDELIRVDPLRPIFTHRDGENLLCACNGHLLRVPAHPQLPRLIAELNRGRLCRVGELAACWASCATVDDVEYELDADGVRALLGALAGVRGFAKCGRSSSTNPQEAT
jgi:hypothetical protein